jgi:hypothetical protein
MSLKQRIQNIAQETATQVVSSTLAGTNATQTSNPSTLAQITNAYTDSNGNNLADVTDTYGNVITGVYVTNSQPYGVGATISMFNAGGVYVGQ